MRVIVSAILILCTLSSCNDAIVLSELASIDSGKWGFEDARTVTAELNDTIAPMNYFIQIRHGANYSYRNLIIYFKTYYPNNTYKIDTIDCPLAEKSGKWFGSGLGDLLDNRIMFKRNVQLSQSGNYKFEIQHAMRADTIDEIYDIGLRIEKAMN